MSFVDAMFFDLTKHNSISDQVSVRRHQYPLVKYWECTTPEQHCVGVDEPLRIGERTGPHHCPVQAAEGAAGGDKVGLVLVHLCQHFGDVVGPVPVVGVQKGDGIDAEADGVVATDQAGC